MGSIEKERDEEGAESVTPGIVVLWGLLRRPNPKPNHRHSRVMGPFETPHALGSTRITLEVQDTI